MKSQKSERNRYLILIFFLAVIVRFLYFPKDIYFAYDQARDAYVSQEIFAGDMKIQGPPASFPGVYHGSVFYYLFGVIYYLANGSPILLAMFLRVYNAFGVFLIFLISKILFDNRTGYVAGTIYALSFEQSQYALFIGHPALAVLTVFLFYYGLTKLFFEKKESGLIITLLGLGLSIQFHIALIFLIATFIACLIVFRSRLPRINKNTYIYSTLTFLLSTLTYTLSEFKFGFNTIKSLSDYFIFNPENSIYGMNIKNLYLIPLRFIEHNLISFPKLSYITFLATVLALVYFLKQKKLRTIGIFLITWLLSGVLPYLFEHSSLTIYYYTIGGSIPLLIIAAYIVTRIAKIGRILAYGFVVVILLSNLRLINRYNRNGTTPSINVQDKMLLSDELAAIDYLYKKSDGTPYSVYALTNPYKINTTWSYIFEWYARRKYGFIPVWGGDAAQGFKGNLIVNTHQSELPDLKFTIIEPRRGIPEGLVEKFQVEEGYFWKVTEEKSFGEIIVQERIRK